MDELQKLQEANATLQTSLDEAAVKLARAQEALVLRDAKDMVTEALSKIELHKVTKARLIQNLSESAPIKDGQLDKEAFKLKIAEAVKAEVAYLSEAAGLGRIKGMGNADDVEETEEIDAQEAEKSLASSFAALGLSEKGVEVAVKGHK